MSPLLPLLSAPILTLSPQPVPSSDATLPASLRAGPELGALPSAAWTLLGD